ncbi:hypothetical protein A2G96_12055 [Cupriavidus nantongensis]|uniref:Uncharacterized protein n=1 Tax=Cupriavidus nantongensis TaxID=1796606 RepID=A0A142JJZ7_9BURK|nr:hypothetical protein A2G96_12055 [Cupriavidus nantongensis]
MFCDDGIEDCRKIPVTQRVPCCLLLWLAAPRVMRPTAIGTPKSMEAPFSELSIESFNEGAKPPGTWDAELDSATQYIDDIVHKVIGNVRPPIVDFK